MSVRLRVTADELRAPTLRVTGERSHYLIRVRRLSAGDAVELFDGEGWRRDAQVTAVDDGATALQPTASPRQDDPATCVITSIIPLIKGERMDWAIAKLTELGVARIAVVRTERTVVQLDPARAQKRVERYRRLADAAARQCNRADVPAIDAIVPLQTALGEHQSDVGVLFDVGASGSLAGALAATPATVTLVTGPEGGFADAELEMAREAGYVLARLGPRVLRAETAAIAAPVAVGALLGELS